MQDKFVGGLLLPGDETGDCFKFTQNLAAMAAKQGVQFRYGTRIQRLQLSGKQIDGVVTDAGTLKADAYLVALGSYSPLLLKNVGIRIPVYPVKGYSITVPITDASGAPESTVMDETHGCTFRFQRTGIRRPYTVDLLPRKLQPLDARAVAESAHLLRRHRSRFCVNLKDVAGFVAGQQQPADELFLHMGECRLVAGPGAVEQLEAHTVTLRSRCRRPCRRAAPVGAKELQRALGALVVANARLRTQLLGRRGCIRRDPALVS